MNMVPSYRKIDYRIRPAKNIERKMLLESFWRLSEFGRLDSYCYIGFGSLYFNDFIMMHKAFGLKSLVSIESATDDRKRFEENLPFDCIDLKFGLSTTVLPELNWESRSIVWLDYDKAISRTVIDDARLLASRLRSGSILIFSINVHPGAEAGRMDRLTEAVGESKVPYDIRTADLRGTGTAKVSKRIITDEILSALADRNGTLPLGSRMEYEQLFNFHYSDGADMLTVGGIVYDQGQRDIVAKCGFNSLPFYRSDDDAFVIRAPRLTYREVRYLAGRMPIDDLSTIDSNGIPDEDIEAYSRVYRYFPQFSEHEIVG